MPASNWTRWPAIFWGLLDILEGIIAGEERPDWLADKAKGHLRKKRNQLRLVLRRRVTEHHRWMLRRLLEELRFIDQEILCLEQQLALAMQPYEPAVNRLCTIPGVDVITAGSLLAALGPDMTVFADAQHAAS
jgi:transposase